MFLYGILKTWKRETEKNKMNLQKPIPKEPDSKNKKEVSPVA